MSEIEGAEGGDAPPLPEELQKEMDSLGAHIVDHILLPPPPPLPLDAGEVTPGAKKKGTAGAKTAAAAADSAAPVVTKAK